MNDVTATTHDSRPAPKRWTEEEESRLKALFEVDTPLPAIAAEHGRSVGAIEARLQLMDLVDYGAYTALINAPETSDGGVENSGKPWREDEIARLLVVHNTDATVEALTALAVELGRTPRSLALKLVHLGAVVPGKNRNPQPKPRNYPKPKVLARPATASGKRMKVTVTPEFQTALASIEAGENLLILGSAGTGKSTFLKWLRMKLEGRKAYAVLAPTGMAALNVGGQTIHSFFGFKPQLMQGSDAWHKPRNPKVFAKLDLLVIDEVSMVRADVFESIDAFLRKYGPVAGQPFGGVQLVLMGDLAQLPPVVRRDEAEFFESFYATPFFFSSPAWAAGGFATVEFTHIFRQTERPFIDLLNHVRRGEQGAAVLRDLNARVVADTPADAVILAARNRTVDEINTRNLEALGGFPRTYRAETSGDVDPNSFTTPVELVLKVGARVMFTRNDPNQRWVNGSLAVVTACNDDSVTVKMQVNCETHVVEAVKWESTKYKFDEATQAPVPTVAGTFSQLPLALAWALTIHKAQGQTLEQCVIDLSDGGAFAEGQLYVALSRARSLAGLYLATPVKARDIRTHPAVVDFYRHLAAARA